MGSPVAQISIDCNGKLRENSLTTRLQAFSKKVWIFNAPFITKHAVMPSWNFVHFKLIYEYCTNKRFKEQMTEAYQTKKKKNKRILNFI